MSTEFFDDFREMGRLGRFVQIYRKMMMMESERMIVSVKEGKE